MKTTASNFTEQLEEIEACSEAIQWVADRSLSEAWAECERGDWMFWIYRRAKNYDLRICTLAKGHCANTVRHLMKDDRSKKAVDVAIAFGEGLATRQELTAAAAAAYAAAAYAAYAAYADAADAAYAAAADAYAADAAYAAADAYAAARRNARKDNQKATADICRKYLPIPVL